MLDEPTAGMYRSMTGTERLRIAFCAQEFAARVVEARVRREHPEWDDDRVHAEVSRRLLAAAFRRENTSV